MTADSILPDTGAARAGPGWGGSPKCPSPLVGSSRSRDVGRWAGFMRQSGELFLIMTQDLLQCAGSLLC